jgi:hypothetical protein
VNQVVSRMVVFCETCEVVIVVVVEDASLNLTENGQAPALSITFHVTFEILK